MAKDTTNDINYLNASKTWAKAFGHALTQKDAKTAAPLFLQNGHWRDLIAFNWNIDTVSGPDAIAKKLSETLDDVQPTEFRIDDTRTPPRLVTRAGVESIEAFVTFKTKIGIANGVVRLLPDPNDSKTWRAWTFSTTLQEITGHEERLSEVRVGGEAFKREFGGDNWQDYRNKARSYEDRDPAVLVVGGGQAGLGIAARLTHLGVDTLIVDRHTRIGDNWRKRYHSLTLHNEVYVNHMPYMPFPPTWPVYIPKDMLANWFEIYVEALELNYWTGTSLTNGTYDEAKKRWNVTLEQKDGSERIIYPRHIVMATGVSAIPIMPDLPGLDKFKGKVMHSGQYTTGHEWSGGKAMVLGTGNSAHDVTQDLHACDVDVKMIQRSSTHIVSLTEAQRVYALYAEGPPMDDCDLLATSFPFPVLKMGYRKATAMSKTIDKPLLDGLTARGFKLNDGVDDCGFQMSYLQRGGGYYFDVGCSKLIADGEIDVVHFEDIECFNASGAVLKSGDSIQADLIVLATGYKNQQDTARVYLGDDVADKIGPVWGFSNRGELQNMWQRTAQPGLWFTAGSLAQCRIFSKFLALQIKAEEVGLIET